MSEIPKWLGYVEEYAADYERQRLKIQDQGTKDALDKACNLMTGTKKRVEAFCLYPNPERLEGLLLELIQLRTDLYESEREQKKGKWLHTPGFLIHLHELGEVRRRKPNGRWLIPEEQVLRCFEEIGVTLSESSLRRYRKKYGDPK